MTGHGGSTSRPRARAGSSSASVSAASVLGSRKASSAVGLIRNGGTSASPHTNHLREAGRPPGTRRAGAGRGLAAARDRLARACGGCLRPAGAGRWRGARGAPRSGPPPGRGHARPHSLGSAAPTADPTPSATRSASSALRPHPSARLQQLEHRAEDETAERGGEQGMPRARSRRADRERRQHQKEKDVARLVEPRSGADARTSARGSRSRIAVKRAQARSQRSPPLMAPAGRRGLAGGLGGAGDPWPLHRHDGATLPPCRRRSPPSRGGAGPAAPPPPARPRWCRSRPRPRPAPRRGRRCR